MKEEVIYVSGEEVKRLAYPDNMISFNGYKYRFTPEELNRLENSKLYVMFQKYGILFIKPLHEKKAVIVKRGEKIPKRF